MSTQTSGLSKALGLRTTPSIFFGSAAIIIVFTLAMSIFPGPVQGFFGVISTFLRYEVGWIFTLAITLMVIAALGVAFSRYGRVKMGDDDATPEYSGLAWFGMLFAAGVGAVLMFWGVAEPMNHYANPPMSGTEPFSDLAATQALNIANFHFGLHMWGIFVVPGLAFGYFTYKRKLPPRVSSAFQPLLGDGIHGPWGKAIDIMAIVATVFGLGVSVGLGSLQINSGLNYVFGIPVAGWVQAATLAVITGIGVMSVLAGMDRGVKRLSYANILLAISLLIFVLMFGASSSTMRAIVESTGSYIGSLPVLAFFNDTLAGGGWSGDWTVFYWAWTVTWAPFVGMFFARISKGRTIREFVLASLGLPTGFVIIWMAIYGYNGVVQDRATAPDAESGGALTQTIVEEGNVQAALFQFLQHYPLYGVTAVVATVVIVLFFITSIDSGALVMDSMANGHEEPAPKRQAVFWALGIGAVCAAIVLTSGERGLGALQEVIIVIGFPVILMTLGQILMVIQALREDAGAAQPIRTRQWKQVLPPEEYDRRLEENTLDADEYTRHPEYEVGTEPEYDLYQPQTRAWRETQEGRPQLIIGLTGPAASGASQVASMLGEHGAVVIDLDPIAREVLTDDAEALAEVREVFGDDVFAADGTLDRPKLGAVVFPNSTARKRLWEIVHPRVQEIATARAKAAGEDAIVVIDAPLLVETGSTSLVDVVLAVEAPAEARRLRLEDRGFTTAEAWDRIDARADEEERREAADAVIENDGDLEHLRASVDEFWAERVVENDDVTWEGEALEAP